jgi:hypothetical protein
MNNLPEGHQAGDGENRGRGVEEDGPFVPRTLLDYATPQAKMSGTRSDFHI